MKTQTEYDENYPTCQSTYAWLRIMSDNMNPEEITNILNISPTRTQRSGEFRSSNSTAPYKKSGWFLSTENIIKSLDSRHHLDWILEKIDGKDSEFAYFHQQKYLIDICVNWHTIGHGGPTLSPKQLLGFGQLGIEIWFDFYANNQNDT